MKRCGSRAVPLNRYLAALVDAASGWITGTSSADYGNYDKIITALKRETFESQVEAGAAWVGTPSELVDRIAAYDEAVGGIDDASLQVNFNDMSLADAEHSVRLFGEKGHTELRRRESEGRVSLLPGRTIRDATRTRVVSRLDMRPLPE